MARIRTGELRINELGVTLPLQRSNNTNEQFTTIATFECGTATGGGGSGHKELQSCSDRFSKMFEVFAECHFDAGDSNFFANLETREVKGGTD